MYLQINPQHHTVDFALFIQNTAGWEGVEWKGKEAKLKDLPINFLESFLTIHSRRLKWRGAVGTI